MGTLVLLALTVSGPGDPLPVGKAKLARVAEVYDIIVDVAPHFPCGDVARQFPYGMIDGKPASERELATYTPLFVKEFSLYPPELVKRSRLKRVVLCKELSVLFQPRSAVPDMSNDTLYLDVASYAYAKLYQVRTIHHDFFHMVDERMNLRYWADDRWSSLNRPGFRYGSGGWNAQGLPWSGDLTDEYSGFLNYYSTTAAGEDKAEVFANLVAEPAHVERRVKDDAVLRAKVRLMKERLADFCPKLNDAFWEEAKKTKR